MLHDGTRFRWRGEKAPGPGSRMSVLEPVTDGGSTAILRLYDPIDSWGGEWGVSAKEFAATLGSLPKDVNRIRLHINSPGGEVFEAVAILNMLRTHPAQVTAVVDGLAASAASFLAAGSDEVRMGRNTQMMIHDAWGICIGNAADMRDVGERLDRLSDNVAGIYADRNATTAAVDWRAAMLAETWFSAEESVGVGLADSVDGTAEDAPRAAFDLSAFKYAGRQEAPDPALPVKAAEAPDPAPEPAVAGSGRWPQSTHRASRLRERSYAAGK